MIIKNENTMKIKRKRNINGTINRKKNKHIHQTKKKRTIHKKMKNEK